MTLKNRTGEFKSIVESIRQTHPQLPNGKSPRASSRSQFTRLAADLARDINDAAVKLEKLTKLVKKKSIFDDRPVEIQELTFIIKQDINNLNGQIAQLNGFVLELKKQKANSQQAQDFSNQIVLSLQSKLASTSTSFKDVLEIRTQNMKAQKDRREQFSAQPLPVQKAPANNTSALYRRALERPEKEDFVAIEMGGAQSLEMVQQQDTYSEARFEEIQNIDSTIQQLGSIFEQLARLITEQGEQVEIIDRFVDEANDNILEGEKQLVANWRSQLSNRWLMLKIFGVLIVFFIVFVVFFA